MKSEQNTHILDNTNTFFDYSFETLDLNKDFEKIYELIDDEELYDAFEENVRLTNLRNENHKRYYKINILKYKDLPQDLDDIVNDIINLYNFIDSKLILTANNFDSNNTKTLLDNIYRRIDRLDRVVKSYLKHITKNNDDKQSKFSVNYFKNLDINNELSVKLIDKYNDLVIYSSFITQDIYEDLKRQVKREQYISEILKLLNIEEEKKINLQKKDKLNLLNKKIDKQILKYKDKIQYLIDIMPPNSKYITKFNEFKDFCNKLFAYDDESYDNTKQTFEVLSDELRFNAYISNFEELFIQEIIDNQKEEEFVFEKIGIKNMTKSLDYITENYINNLSEEDKNIINEIQYKLTKEYFNLEEIKKELNVIVKNIWKNTITDVYSFNPNEDYCFICSNNQFIDERYQTILISKNEINKVNDYQDYQIGFICGYNDNIMYITENEDIMSVSNLDDMSYLKTPIQIEKEFISFKVCNRIALNGFKTKIQAVYYIDDGNKEKYIKAIEMSNMYKLPLIVLKKDN